GEQLGIGLQEIRRRGGLEQQPPGEIQARQLRVARRCRWLQGLLPPGGPVGVRACVGVEGPDVPGGIVEPQLFMPWGERGAAGGARHELPAVSVSGRSSADGGARRYPHKSLPGAWALVCDTPKISGRFASGHCLRSDFAPQLGEAALDLGRDRRELLGARAQLVHELSGELGMLAHQLGGVGRAERNVHARQAALQHVAGDGVLQPRQALEGLEAFLLRLENRRERLTGRGNYRVRVKSPVDHVVSPLRVSVQWPALYSILYALQEKRER